METAKPALRKEIRTRRRERTPEQITAAGRLIAAHLVPLLDGVGIVAAFASTPHEPATTPILEVLAEAGCEIRLPQFGKSLARTWSRYTPGDPLSEAVPGRPPLPSGPLLGEESIAEVDLVLAPALAVDRFGTRLGQGGGWYDRALLHRRPGVPVYGIVFADEFVPGPLPRSEHDLPLDGVITPEGFTALPV